MNIKEVQVGKNKIFLSERLAVDTFALAEFFNETKPKIKNALEYNFFVYAAVVADSIRAYRKSMPWYRVFSRIKYALYTRDKLLKVLSQQDLLNLYSEVMLIEGIDVKKKLNQPDSQ
jgi:phosphopantothenoylcysteine synthetase/decarboxylase